VDAPPEPCSPPALERPHDLAQQLLRDAEERQIAALRRAATTQDWKAVLARRYTGEGISVEKLNRDGRLGSLSAVRAAVVREIVARLALSLAQAVRPPVP
jgi:hypothetical protein